METNDVSFYSDSLQIGASYRESLASAKFSIFNELAARTTRITERTRNHFADEYSIHE